MAAGEMIVRGTSVVAVAVVVQTVALTDISPVACRSFELELVLFDRVEFTCNFN